ncbi:MAG: UDP-2,4-diacetamido-2,4,6-trideoxy-beta-L-altropyranose hydrolase [Gammaproteobacteria bacterium]|nr:UDP-2,4-diacetamido-2,4,6-trideoxy-beta-L-altropyranose hydrolase [Gammaproteobacteria bacterium]
MKEGIEDRIAVFRSDASLELGTGHVRRCLALLTEFKAMGWGIGISTDYSTPGIVPELPISGARVHLIDGKLPPRLQIRALAKEWPKGVDVVVVDHYGLDATFERELKKWARLVVVLDDMANRRHDCDLLFDSGPGRRPSHYAAFTNSDCRVMTGPDFALMSPAFAKLRAKSRARRRNHRVRRIAISLGGGDSGGLARRVLEGIERVGFSKEVELVLGVSSPAIQRFCVQDARPFELRIQIGVDVLKMAQILARADLAIGAGGSSSWERCCLGVPTLVIVTARNQREIVDGLSHAGAIVVAGWHEDVTASGIADLLGELIQDADRLVRISRVALDLCDGNGAKRTAQTILEHLQEAA